MTAFEKFIKIIADWRMEAPAYYGAFHIIWLSAAFTACVIIVLLRRRISMRAVNVTLIVWGVLLIFLEALKQTVCSFSYVGDKAVWSYCWWAFPFQYCSVPLYLAVPAGALKDGVIKNTLVAYLATFALIGGLCASFLPVNMFSDLAFLSYHTMFWHTSMVVVGVLLWAAGAVKTHFKVMLWAAGLFAAFVLIALALNITVYKTVGEVGFNMFFISPYEPFNVPIIKHIYGAITFYGYLPLYLLTVTAAALAIFFAVRKISGKRRRIRR